MVIDGSEIYWYKYLNDMIPQIMHSLVNTFAKVLPEEEASEGLTESMVLWPIKIVIPPNKSRIIYFETQQ